LVAQFDHFVVSQALRWLVVCTVLCAHVSVAAAPSKAPSSDVYFPGQAEAARFKNLFEQGENFYHQKEYGLAIATFRQADALKPSAEIAYDLAKCFEKLSDIPTAALYYSLYLRRSPQSSDANTVSNWLQRQQQKWALDGKAVVFVMGPFQQEVRIDGVSVGYLPAAVLLSAGAHRVLRVGEAEVVMDLVSGSTLTLAQTLVAPPLPAAPELWASAPPSPKKFPRMRVAGIALLGVGVALAAVGVGLGASAQHDWQAAQNKTLLYPQARQLADASGQKGLGANVLFTGAGVAGILGSVLLGLSFAGESK
jgi:tetratricopeptide (TPR) repeat protein